MNKSDLIELLVQKLPNLSSRDVEVIVSTIFDSMTEQLKKGGTPCMGSMPSSMKLKFLN